MHAEPEDLDGAVLARLRARDPGALEACYRLHGTRVYRLCRAMLRQDSDAEDATQEVFLKLFERAHQFERRARFTTWLHRLAVNHCLNRIEHEGRRRTGTLDDALAEDAPSPVDRAHAAESQDRLDALLERLPAEQRAVLVLREVDGASYADIAAILAIPVGTVMSRLARARERLSNLVAPETLSPGSNGHAERALRAPRNAS